MKDTPIGWCHHTINFWMGCDHVSKECEGCYAREMMEGYGENFGVLRLTQGPWLEAELLNARAKTRNEYELVFTCSMSDFFHSQADPWRSEAWDVIRRCRNLIWLILTKRPERICENLPSDWDEGRTFPHVWLGTTCGVRRSFKRVDELRSIPCSLRFLSCEPLIEDIRSINLNGIGWILCGGMSGKCSKKYPMKMTWASSLHSLAREHGVPFLLKPESGINALGLFLAHVHRKPLPAAPFDCEREYPELPGFPIRPPEIRGLRLSEAEWGKYCKKQNINLWLPPGTVENPLAPSVCVPDDSAVIPD